MLRDHPVQKTMSVYPPTVTNVSRQLLDQPDKTIYRSPRRKARKAPEPAAEATQFHPVIWKMMMEKVDHDVYRLVAFSPTDLRTLNRPRPAGSSIWDTQYATKSA